ncbi:MAG: Xaa-Pro peptidase family protein [Limnochordales bacterium]|nr:Xaa-Pro peptidase family protein [Limnochordales bacterium]
MSTRLERLRARFAEAGIDALLVTGAANRRYLSGFTGSAGTLLITRDKALLLTDFRYVEQAGRQAPDFQIVHYDDPIQAIGEQAAKVPGRRIGFEAEHVTVAQMEKLRQAADVEWVATQRLVEEVRGSKEPGELALIEAAVALADRCFEHILPQLKPGVTEREIAWRMEVFMREQGAEGLAFPSIVASGPNGAMPHARPTDKPLAAGEFVTLDFGCIWQGYCSDITRTVFLGEPTAQHRELYDLVLRAQEAGIAAVRPGRTGREVDAAAREVIAQAGYGDRFGHGLGHGLGLEVHEEIPRLSTRSETVLAPGMVTSVEPGVYLPGWGGIRIEDLVVVTEDGCRVLTKSPKQLLCLPV